MEHKAGEESWRLRYDVPQGANIIILYLVARSSLVRYSHSSSPVAFVLLLSLIIFLLVVEQVLLSSYSYRPPKYALVQLFSYSLYRSYRIVISHSYVLYRSSKKARLSIEIDAPGEVLLSGYCSGKFG